MITITKFWPLYTIFIIIFAFSFSFIGSESWNLVITISESWIESWFFVIMFSFINPEYWSLGILHFFFQPLWNSAFFRAGNVVDVGCHSFPFKLQIAVSFLLLKCPILTVWMKLTGLLAIQCRFLGIVITNVVTKICSVIFETRLFSYGHFFSWKPRIS